MSDAEIKAKTPWWRRSTTIGCAACLVPLVAYMVVNFIVFGPVKKRRDTENRLRGESLASTLERYQDANGRYPETLAVLEQSGAQIPHLSDGHGGETYGTFEYAIQDSGASFTLQFREAPMMPMDDYASLYEWSSRTNAWEHLPP